MKKLLLALPVAALLAGCGAEYQVPIPASTTPKVLIIEDEGSLDRNDVQAACGYIGSAKRTEFLPDWNEDKSAALVTCGTTP